MERSLCADGSTSAPRAAASSGIGKSARRTLTYGTRRPSTIANPTLGIDKVQKPAPDPFAPDEVEVVLEVLRRIEGEEMADWFEFAFFAGIRTSEQIALPWTDVDLRTHTAVVKQARVMARDQDRTKTNVERTVDSTPEPQSRSPKKQKSR